MTLEHVIGAILLVATVYALVWAAWQITTGYVIPILEGTIL